MFGLSDSCDSSEFSSDFNYSSSALFVGCHDVDHCVYDYASAAYLLESNPCLDTGSPVLIDASCSCEPSSPPSNPDQPEDWAQWKPNSDLSHLSLEYMAMTFGCPLHIFCQHVRGLLRGVQDAPPQRHEQKGRFQWTKDKTLVFSYAYTYICKTGGVPTPRRILDLISGCGIEVNIKQVESKLQKLRLGIRRSYGLTSKEILGRRHIPKNIDWEMYKQFEELFHRIQVKYNFAYVDSTGCRS